MIRFIAALALVLWPSLLSARTYEVKSGEHVDFSRVVIRFVDVPEWSLGRIDGGYELRHSDTNADYDLSRVFEMIPRDRIRSLEPRPGGDLFFAVDCNCHADAFEIRAGLVIDIKDGPPPSNSSFEQAFSPMPGSSIVAADASGIAAMPKTLPTRPAMMNDLRQQFLGERSNLVWTKNLADEAQLTPPNKPSDTPSMEVTKGELGRVAEVQEALVEQLGRAAAQGLVTVDLSVTEARVERTRPAQPDGSYDLADLPAHPTEFADIVEAMTGPNVRIETAVDRGTRNKPDLPAITVDGADCLPSQDFDIVTWGSEPNSGDPLALSRTSIVGEFDAANPDSIKALAKHYIYLTFGTEARALIGAFDTEIRGSEILATLAEIMDFGKPLGQGLARDQMACDTNAAMWAVLSNPDLSRGDQISRQAVLSAFTELPLHLRRHLGPYLADRFLAIEDIDTASAIRDSIARAPGQHGDGFNLMNAQISLELGHSEQGLTQLDGIAAADGPLAPEALVHRIDSTLDSRRPLPSNMSNTAAALAFEARGTEMGAELLRAHLRALAHSGEILAALEASERAQKSGEIAANTGNMLRLEIYQLAASTTSDTTFLTAAMAGPLVLNQDEKATKIRREFAARLIRLGFPDDAREVLAEIGGVPSPDDRHLFARSFLLEQRPELAIGYLAGLTDTKSTQLRARSHELAGEYDRAASVFAAIGDDGALARAVWRGQDWAKVAEIGTVAERAAAALAVDEEPGKNVELGTLARDRGLLQQSQETRRLLGALLDATAKP